MKTLSEIEKELDDCSQSLMSQNEIKLFYRQAIAKLLEEIVGEDCQCLDDEAGLWIDGYDSAKAEIREKIKQIEVKI